MFEWLKFAFNLLRNLNPSQSAHVMAYWIAPGAVVLFTATGVFGGYFVSDTAVPVLASELRSEVLSNGTVKAKPGMALLVEPAKADFRISIDPPPAQVWSSLDPAAAHENKDQLFVDGDSLGVRTPFMGIGEPVAIVVTGSVGKSVHVPGGTETLDNLLARSRRSIAAAAGVLLVCMFAFGMSSASGMPSVDPE